jgi:hypothetical protein
MVAEAAIDHAVGQFESGVELFRIVEAFEQKSRPLVKRRKVVTREGVDMRRGPEHGHPPASACLAMTTF